MRKSPTEWARVGKLQESVWNIVRQENERPDQGEGVQNSGRTGTGVHAIDMDIE